MEQKPQSIRVNMTIAHHVTMTIEQMERMFRMRITDIPLSPVYGDPDLYYRHAKGENLFFLGPESNANKAIWVKQQVDMFTALGWRFIVLDMSRFGDMGAAMIVGGSWTNIERNAVQHMQPPVIVRIKKFGDLLNTLDDINLMKSEQGIKHTIVVHLGDMRTLAQDEKDALFSALLKISTYKDGLWLIAEHFQTFPMEYMDLFQTQIVMAQEEPDIALPAWQKRFNLEDCDVTELEQEEAYFLFRGRSEGANNRFLIGNMRQREEL